MNLKFKMKNSNKEYLYKGTTKNPHTGEVAFLYQDVETKEYYYSPVEMAENSITTNAEILLG